MSIQGIQAPSPLQPPAPIRTESFAPAGAFGGLSFDRFQRAQSQPDTSVSSLGKLTTLLFHPFRYLSFSRAKFPAGQGEGTFERVKMYRTLGKALDRDGRKQLESLLKAGILNDTTSDNGHSTLYHLYAMLTTQRARGYDPKLLLKETLNILSRPFLITQKFEPLSENAARQILHVRNNPGLNRLGIAPPPIPLQWADLNVTSSATCVSSSVMYYMADKKPSELARHLSELTSPMNAFYEKARLDEISPDDPRQATEILKQQGIKYYISGPGEVTVRVELPPAGMIRAIDSQDVLAKRQAKFIDPATGKATDNPNTHYRTGIETAYQSALTHLATRSYDPATDYRDSEIPGEGSKGLTEQEKTLMETIIKDNGGVQSVTYQVVAGKANPAPGEEVNSYLYGYTRTFEQTVADIVDALRMGEFVIIGITDTDAGGAIIGGHEVTITGAFAGNNGEIQFIVADSDDDTPSLVVRSAREMIPRIHHAGLPLKLARRINQEINANPGYFTPDQGDAASFNLLSQETGPMPQEAPPPDTTPQTAPQPKQVVEWVPVYQYYPTPMPMQPAPYAPFYPQAAQAYWPQPGIRQFTMPGAPVAPGYNPATSLPGFSPNAGPVTGSVTTYPGLIQQPQAPAA